MNIDEQKVRLEIVHGLAHFVPDFEHWPYFVADGKFQGKSVYSAGIIELINQHIDLATKYRELIFGFRSLSANAEYYTVGMLLKTAFGLQPVHIERLSCESCGWEGLTGNPMVSDLYLGMSDRWTAMRNAERHPVLPCPRCAAPLPRHPIWIEPLV